MRVLTEVCVTGLEEALVATHAGADHLELCAWLECGGVTPSIGMVRAVAEACAIPVRVLVRPRPGEMRYDRHDRVILLRDVEAFCQEPAVTGVVTGALDRDAMPDRPLMAEVMRIAAGREVTFHRAMDHAADPVGAIASCKDLGIQRVLTSAGAMRAIDGVPVLAAMCARAGHAMTVAAGGGVAAAHVVDLVQRTAVPEVHFSARRWVAPSTHAGERVELSSSGASMPVPWVPDAEKTRAIIHALVQAGLR